MSKTISINAPLAKRLDAFRPEPKNGRKRSYSEVIEMAMALLEDSELKDSD